MAVLKSPRNVANKKRWAYEFKTTALPSLYALGTLKYKRLVHHNISFHVLSQRSITSLNPTLFLWQFSPNNFVVTALQMFQFSQYGLTSLYLIRFTSILNSSYYTGNNIFKA